MPVPVHYRFGNEWSFCSGVDEFRVGGVKDGHPAWLNDDKMWCGCESTVRYKYINLHTCL